MARNDKHIILYDRLSDENSVTLLDAGALHLPTYSEEEEDEKVEQLGLHLNETADRLNEEYKSTPPITMEKPFSLQVFTFDVSVLSYSDSVP